MIVNGQAWLRDILARVDTATVAATCRVSTRAVRQWANGDVEPTRPHRAALERFRVPALLPWKSSGNRRSEVRRART